MNDDIALSILGAGYASSLLLFSPLLATYGAYLALAIVSAPMICDAANDWEKYVTAERQRESAWQEKMKIKKLQTQLETMEKK